MLPHSIRLLEREIRRAEAELTRVRLKSEDESLKVMQRIEDMRVELTKLKVLSEMFITDRDLGTAIEPRL